MMPCATYLIKSASNGWADDESHANERLQIGKHGADVPRELPGDDGESGGGLGRVANRLNDPDDIAERNEDPGVVKVVQQPKEYGAGAGGEDAEVEHPACSPCIDLGPDVWTGDEYGELKYAKNKAVLYMRE